MFQERTNKNKIKKERENKTMKLTKVLREKVLRELNDKRLSLNKEAGRDYKDRKDKASEEIREYLQTVATAEIQKILAKYNMDTDNVITDQNLYTEILDYRPGRITNNAECKKINNEADDRYNKMKKMVEDFEIECELGVEKDQFFEALANLCAKFENETK
jgi:hypothetical protein